METEKEEKPSSVSGGETRKKKTYQKIRDDKQEWNRVQRARLRHGLPLQSWPPTTEVKQGGGGSKDSKQSGRSCCSSGFFCFLFFPDLHNGFGRKPWRSPGFDTRANWREPGADRTPASFKSSRATRCGETRSNAIERSTSSAGKKASSGMVHVSKKLKVINHFLTSSRFEHLSWLGPQNFEFGKEHCFV